MPSLSPSPLGDASDMKGGRRGLPVKTLKRFLKKAGLKVSGKKAALTRRAKKAGLRIGGGGMGEMKMVGGVDDEAMGGRRRRGSRKVRPSMY